MDNTKQANKMKVVYSITERGESKFWNRVGAGFVNRDGSINLKLDALPVNGSLQIRDWEPKDHKDHKAGSRPNTHESFVDLG